MFESLWFFFIYELQNFLNAPRITPAGYCCAIQDVIDKVKIGLWSVR